MLSLKRSSLTKSLTVTTLLATAFTSLSPLGDTAFAGTKDGGGGGAYVCRDGKGRIRYSMLADLWESANVAQVWPHKKGKLNIIYDNKTSAKKQFERAMDKLADFDETFAEKVRAEARYILANRNLLPAGVSIALPQDLKVGYFPTGCQPEGMMYYNGVTDALDVRTDIFNALRTRTDQAASLAHEAIYKLLRNESNQSESRNSRKMVGCLFSDDPNCLGPKKINMEKFNPEIMTKFTCKSADYDLDIISYDKSENPEDHGKPGQSNIFVLARKLKGYRMNHELSLSLIPRKSYYPNPDTIENQTATPFLSGLVHYGYGKPTLNFAARAELGHLPVKFVRGQSGVEALISPNAMSYDSPDKDYYNPGEIIRCRQSQAPHASASGEEGLAESATAQ